MVRLISKMNIFCLGMISGIAFMLCLDNVVNMIVGPELFLVRTLLSTLFGTISIICALVTFRKM